MGQTLEGKSDDIEPILTSIKENRLDEITGWYHNGSYHLAYADPESGNIYNDRELIIDLERGTFTIDKKNISSYGSWNSGTDAGELYTGTSDTTGLLHNEDFVNWDIVMNTKAQLDAGTFGNYAESGGTEVLPTAILKAFNYSPRSKVNICIFRCYFYFNRYRRYYYALWWIYKRSLRSKRRNLRYLYWNETLAAGGNWHLLYKGRNYTCGL